MFLPRCPFGVFDIKISLIAHVVSADPPSSSGAFYAACTVRSIAVVFLPMRIGKLLNQAVHRIIRHGKDDNRPLTWITLNV